VDDAGKVDYPPNNSSQLDKPRQFTHHFLHMNPVKEKNTN